MERRPHSLTRREIIGLALASTAAAAAWRPALAQEARVYTFAVLGTDYRGPDRPELTDVLMVSRVDLDAGTVRTLSIPRDLYVEIPGHGYDKINAAYNIAVKADPGQRWDIGAASTVATIEHNFGLGIDGAVQTDMSVFPQIVDAVGGVVVDNPYEIVTVFPGVTFPAGEITLDGEHALMFCRERKADSDAGRVMRQHLVLQALLARLQEPGMIASVPELVETLAGGVVRTNIDPAVQGALIAALPTIEPGNLAFTNIEDQLGSGYTSGGAWIYQGDWSTLPGYVQDWLAG